MIFLLFALCIWKSCSPFVFVFYHVAKFMQEITPSIKSLPGRCRKGCSMMKYEYFSQKKKKKNIYHETCFVLFFQHTVFLEFIVGVPIITYSLVSRMWLHSAKNCVLAECTEATFFLTCVAIQACASVLKSPGRFYVSLGMT